MEQPAPNRRRQSLRGPARQKYRARPGAQNNAGWSSPVARQAHNLKAAGSNPAPATKHTKFHIATRSTQSSSPLRSRSFLRSDRGSSPPGERSAPDRSVLRRRTDAQAGRALPSTDLAPVHDVVWTTFCSRWSKRCAMKIGAMYAIRSSSNTGRHSCLIQSLLSISLFTISPQWRRGSCRRDSCVEALADNGIRHPILSAIPKVTRASG